MALHCVDLCYKPRKGSLMPGHETSVVYMEREFWLDLEERDVLSVHFMTNRKRLCDEITNMDVHTFC